MRKQLLALFTNNIFYGFPNSGLGTGLFFFITICLAPTTEPGLEWLSHICTMTISSSHWPSQWLQGFCSLHLVTRSKIVQILQDLGISFPMGCPLPKDSGYNVECHILKSSSTIILWSECTVLQLSRGRQLTHRLLGPLSSVSAASPVSQRQSWPSWRGKRIPGRPGRQGLELVLLSGIELPGMSRDTKFPTRLQANDNLPPQCAFTL